MHRSRSLLLSAGKAAKDAVFGNPEAAYPYKLLYHHRDPSLFPNRIPGTFNYLLHNATSAISAVFSLCTSQASRDEFLALTGSGTWSGSDDGEDSDKDGSESIIRTKILGQSDVGFLKVLTLYQDLHNPLFEKNPGFRIQDFMGGCGWALERFHRSKDELIPKMVDSVEEAKEESGLSRLTCNYNILDVASKNQDSLEHDLVSMTTPLVLELIQLESIVMQMGMRGVRGFQREGVLTVDGIREDDVARPENDKTYVANIALLSANVAEIYPSAIHLEDDATQKKKSDDDPDAPLEDDSFLLHLESKFGPQTVVRLEVLHELQQTVIDADENTRARNTVLVATFETCLNGDPNGDELRWRISHYRPAVEFGFFH